MKPDFSFANELNDFIKYVAQGGLVTKWLKDNQAQHKYERPEIKTFPLKLELYGGAFIIFGSLWALSCLVAIAERIVHKKAKQPKAKKFWIYAEIAIDADRHFLLGNYKL